jgi:hypothetical protein
MQIPARIGTMLTLGVMLAALPPALPVAAQAQSSFGIPPSGVLASLSEPPMLRPSEVAASRPPVKAVAAPKAKENAPSRRARHVRQDGPTHARLQGAVGNEAGLGVSPPLPLAHGATASVARQEPDTSAPLAIARPAAAPQPAYGTQPNYGTPVAAPAPVQEPQFQPSVQSQFPVQAPVQAQPQPQPAPARERGLFAMLTSRSASSTEPGRDRGWRAAMPNFLLPAPRSSYGDRGLFTASAAAPN